MTENKKTVATWKVSLDCLCPYCSHEIDLSGGDFIGNSQIEFGEHETDRTTDMEAFCPMCGAEFTVDLEY